MEEALNTASRRKIFIKTTEKYGRGIYADENIHQGDTILLTRPLVYAVSADQMSLRCSYCIKRLEESSGMRCSQCQHHHYCSKNCQRKDWKEGHKEECEDLQRLEKNLPYQGISNQNKPFSNELARVVGRILRIHKNRPKDYEMILQMYSIRNLLNEKELENLAITAQTCSQMVDSKYSISVNEILNLLAILTSNNFSLSDEDVIPCGVAISPITAILNHSCWPNAVVIFNSSNMLVQAITEIKSGDQIFTSYVDIGQYTKERQYQLEKTYKFICECERCQNNLPDEKLKLNCINCQSLINYQDGKKCLKCGMENIVSDDISERLDYLDINNNPERTYEELISKDHISILNLPILSLIRKLFFINLDQENYLKALEYSKQIHQINENFYPILHPVRILSKYTILRLRTELSRFQHELSGPDIEILSQLTRDYMEIREEIKKSLGPKSIHILECNSYIANIGPMIGINVQEM